MKHPTTGCVILTTAAGCCHTCKAYTECPHTQTPPVDGQWLYCEGCCPDCPDRKPAAKAAGEQLELGGSR